MRSLEDRTFKAINPNESLKATISENISTEPVKLDPEKTDSVGIEEGFLKLLDLNNTLVDQLINGRIEAPYLVGKVIRIISEMVLPLPDKVEELQRHLSELSENLKCQESLKSPERAHSEENQKATEDR